MRRPNENAQIVVLTPTCNQSAQEGNSLMPYIDGHICSRAESCTSGLHDVFQALFNGGEHACVEVANGAGQGGRIWNHVADFPTVKHGHLD